MKTFKHRLQLIIVCVICSYTSFAQNAQDWLLEQMPPDLEMEYALSALPARLRDQATVYLLDPKKGYYIGRQGTNGFAAFVSRTQWEWAEFVPDVYTPISYDAEGVKTCLLPYLAVAEMRASGKYTPAQIRDVIIQRVKDGTYKAPARTGISYMLGPITRDHVGEVGMVNSVMPHYMFYAPGVDNKDIGGKFDGHSPFTVNSDNGVLDKEHSIFNYIIVPAGESEKVKILEENKELMQRLGAYKPYFKVKIGLKAGAHQH